MAQLVITVLIGRSCSQLSILCDDMTQIVSLAKLCVSNQDNETATGIGLPNISILRLDFAGTAARAWRILLVDSPSHSHK